MFFGAIAKGIGAAVVEYGKQRIFKGKGCVDWADVFIHGIVGTVKPGLFSSGKKAFRSYRQFAKGKNKFGRMEAHAEVIEQVMWMGGRRILTEKYNCTVGDNCEC